ncbi:MAG: PAS domain-containing hybrid sensor histidine kinase/response regulator [Thermodesulfobacteriota bacterium]
MPSFRLRTHLILYCTVVTLLLTAALIVLYSRLFQQHSIDSLTTYGKTIAMNTSFSVADDLITEDYAPLQEFVRECSSRANVDAIQIADRQGNILAASEVGLLGTRMAEEPPGTDVSRHGDLSVKIDDDRKQLVMTAPITVGDTVLGRTRVFLSMKPGLAHLRTIQRNAALTGVVFWAFAVLLGTLLAQRMCDPLRRFIQVTDSISGGDFNVQIPFPRGVYELERFSKTLRVMAGTIASRELALQNSEKKFRHLFERAMEGIFVANGKGELLDVNPAFLAILGGGSREAMIGRNLFGSIFENEETFARFREGMAARKYVKDFEVVLLKNDSTPATVALTCHAIVGIEGNVHKYEGMVRDITAQKRAEQEIARMRNYLNNIIESMPSMLITLDHDTVVTQWNTAASEITGIPPQEAIGKKISEVAPLFDKYFDQVDASNRNRKPIKLHRERLTDDDERFYNLTFFPLVANGVEGVAIRLDDVTELERKEQQLRQAQKMESIGTLAGGLAHDFNNVLAGILGNLSLLRYKLNRQREGVPAAEIRDHLDRMETAGQRAVDMVRQLLTLSRKQQADLVAVDLNLSIKHVRKIAENTFDKSVQLMLQPFETPACVLADPTEIEQVLLNLCINAAHAMTIMRGDSSWGGVLTVAVEPVVADEAFRYKHPEATETPYWKISVNDTGVGMDTRTVAKIFDPFFTTKEQGKGTGLGLAMVYNIVRQQQGFIDVYSEPGLGSTFNVYLPQLSRTEMMGTPEEKSVVAGGEGVILLVDDDDVVRAMAEEVLRTVGYTVLTAANGREGVTLFREHRDRISAVLLDMAMPVMSGREAFLEMQKIDPGVKVVLASGFRKDNRVDEILALGVKEFLQKPYTIAGLAATLKKAIEG